MKLIFVYNADTGLFNSLTDWTHKVISPSTYECNLCALTHGNFGIKKEWREFIEGIDMEKEFLHRDEFIRKYGARFKNAPCILMGSGNNISEVISNDEINNCKTLDELKQKIERLKIRI